MAVTIKGDNTVIFGTTTVTSTLTSLGYVQNVRKNPTNSEAQVHDGDGEVQAEALYGKKTEYTVELVLKTGGTIPVMGGAITVNGESCYVAKDPDQSWSNNGFSSITVIARRYASFPT